MTDITLKQHLSNVRKKAHETQMKNGHFDKMAEISAKKRKKNK